MGQLQIFDYMYLDLYSEPDRTEILAALKNINVNTTVSAEPRWMKLLSTEAAFMVGDWHRYISDQVDAAGNMSSTSMIKVALDQDASKPSGSLSINFGESFTKWTKATLDLPATGSNGSVISAVRFRNAGGGWSSWASYAPRKT